MIWLTLLAVILAPPPSPIERAAVLEFHRVQEEWIADTAPHHRESSVRPVVRLLGHSQYLTRKSAREVLGLRLHQRRYMGDLIRALHHRDSQVRHHAQGLLDEMFRCPDCGGTGDCARCSFSTRAPGCPCDYRNHCTTCHGSGDLRLDILFSTYMGVDLAGNSVRYDYRVPRDLFPRNDGVPTTHANPDFW